MHARARDAVPSVQLDDQFPVIPVRGLANAGTQRFLATRPRRATACRPARSRGRRPSSASSISGPARCAAR